MSVERFDREHLRGRSDMRAALDKAIYNAPRHVVRGDIHLPEIGNSSIRIRFRAESAHPGTKGIDRVDF